MIDAIAVLFCIALAVIVYLIGKIKTKMDVINYYANIEIYRRESNGYDEINELQILPSSENNSYVEPESKPHVPDDKKTDENTENIATSEECSNHSYIVIVDNDQEGVCSMMENSLTSDASMIHSCVDIIDNDYVERQAGDKIKEDKCSNDHSLESLYLDVLYAYVTDD